MEEESFAEKAYALAQRQALYWLENGNDAEEVAQWLNIVFAIEDRLYETVVELEDEEPGSDSE